MTAGRTTLLAILGAALVALVTVSAAPAADPPGTKRITIERFGQSYEKVVLDPVEVDGRRVRAGSVLVRFKPGTSASEQQAAHVAAQAVDVHPMLLPRAARIEVRAGTEKSALAAYRARPDVDHAELDLIASVAFTPNDPLLGSQWGMTKIRAPEAWDVTHSIPAVKVAVIDCGVYVDSASMFPGHPDLNGKVVANAIFSGTPDADDWCDHGSHVAGTAAAATNNAIGVAGVGFDASIMNGKVCDDNPSPFTQCPLSAIINGIYWAANNDAHVINMSLGGQGACPAMAQDAINYAVNVRNAVVVVAAGNDNTTPPGFPANCTNTLSVAATDSTDARASFSNWGLQVDVAAPGVDILSTDFEGNYVNKSGTSMAAPHVAGLAALVWTTGVTTSAQVVSRITSTALAIAGTGAYWTYGRVDAAAAVTPPAPPTLNWAANNSADFDGDHVTDFGLYRGLSPADSLWYAPGTAGLGPFQIYFGATSDIPVPGDYDGDGKTDAVIYRPSSGLWYGPRTGAASIVIQTILGGMAGDIPIPGDYNGDGATDPAFYRPSSGLFFATNTAGTQVLLNTSFGMPGDVPVPRDYDGDGTTDPAIYRQDVTPEHYSLWYATLSGGGVHQIYFGAPGDIPVPADYNGDEKADSVIWRPSSGLWYGPQTGAAAIVIQMILGQNGDVPIPGYNDANLAVDPGIFRPATGLWFSVLSGGGTRSISGMGQAGDVPVQKRPALAGGV